MSSTVSELKLPGLTLRELVRAAEPLKLHLVGDGAVRVSGLSQDSRRVRPGDLFAARRGAAVKGADFVEAALQQGAVALLTEPGGAQCGAVPRVEVAELRLGIAVAAEAIAGFPSRALKLVGITGTNGKTTVNYLVHHALTQCGVRAGRIGTLGFVYGTELDAAFLTTPEADQLTRYLAEIRAGNGTHCVLEVSSHALALERVAALRFEVAAFTNLTQDHLDFHGTLAEYGATKARLFKEYAPAHAVINVDDAFGAELAASSAGRVLRVSARGPADVWAREIHTSESGLQARVITPAGEYELASELLGEHNLDNLLLAVGILQALNLDLASAVRALKQVQVPGRLERCDEPGDDIRVVVDYAHSPDALSRVLKALRAVTADALVCVFGCGGDRDPTKRPKMGAAVAAGADRAVLTTDNPRSESPVLIAEAVLPGLSSRSIPYSVELDRARAIEHAILEASSGDLVLIAGKGHETYQIIGQDKYPFDDRLEARRALSLRRAGRAS